MVARIPGSRWVAVASGGHIFLHKNEEALTRIARFLEETTPTPAQLRQRKEDSMTTTTIKDAAADFLTKKRVAVTGVSRQPGEPWQQRRLPAPARAGYEVFAVNPNADEVEGERSYHDLGSIPGGVDAVVIGTRPEIAEDTMRECAELGIKHVWMHRGPGAGSVSEAATAYGRARGITVIDRLPVFEPTADRGHKVMRVLFTLTGNVPASLRARGSRAKIWPASRERS